MHYTPYIILIIIVNCSNLLSANITCAQSSINPNTFTPKKIDRASQYDSANYVLNVLTGKAWNRGEMEEEEFNENVEFGQGWLYFKGKYSGIISKDINQIDIRNNRYINFSFVNCDFEDINKKDRETNIYSVNIKLININGDITVGKYVEFPDNIKEKAVSINLRDFSHFINTNTIIKKFIFLDPVSPGKWGFKEVTITEKPTGVLLRYDGYGYAPEEKEGTSLIPQPYISKKKINNINLIKEGEIFPREGTVFDDNGGIISLFGYDLQVRTGGWLDLIIPDEFIVDLKENPIMSLDIKTEADIFNFNVKIRNTDGHLIIGENSDNILLVEVKNKENEWNNYKIDLGEKISNKIKNTKIKSIRFCDLEGKGSRNKNYYEIELTDLYFEK